jgi:hypothetical protein
VLVELVELGPGVCMDTKYAPTAATKITTMMITPAAVLETALL